MLAALRQRDPSLFWCGLASLLGCAAAAVLATLDPRTLLGVGVWLKPGKFAVSIGIYLWTLAWLRPWLPAGPLRPARVVIAATMIVELIAIFAQAARGVGSHFNDATPSDALVFALMGLAIAGNTVALSAVAVAAWRAPVVAAPAFAWAIRLGLAIAVLGSLEGALMIARAGHGVGVADGGPGLPITTWSTVGGDLRVAHFLALHALQALPLLGHRLARRAGRDDRKHRRATIQMLVVGGLWLLACAAALLLALLGRPILRLS